MTEFVICGTLDENKNLIFQGNPTCNQGENATTKLSVTLPGAMAEDVDFYFEFLCPHNLWISPKATKTDDGTTAVITYTLGGYLLSEEGQVMVQLVARNVEDQRVVYKSSLSSQSCIYVAQSVNVQTSHRAEDFFGEAQSILQQLGNQPSDLAPVAYSGDYADLDNAPQNVGDFNNDQGYVTTETLTPLLPTRVGQLQNDAGFITADDVSNSEISIKLGSTVYGKFNLNQTADKTIALPAPSDYTVSLWQAGVEKGKFSLNQSSHKVIFLDGGPITSFCSTEYISHDENLLVDGVDNCIVDLIVSSDEECFADYGGDHSTERYVGVVSSLTINGVQVALEEAPYHFLQLVPYRMDQRWAIVENGNTLGYAPFEDPYEEYVCLSVGVSMDNQSGGVYVHYSVR